MNTIVVVVLAIAVAYLGWQKIKSLMPRQLNDITPKDEIALAQAEINGKNKSINLLQDEWWKALDDVDQLHLALSLARKALPIWERFTQTQEIVYRNTSTGPFNKIESQLLYVAIEEMQLRSQLQYPASDHKKINQCYYNFVGPVLALQDGAWTAPYPVKRIFLSVYNILKSILEKNSVPGFQNYLATAINQSIDCLEVSKLYSRNEIAVFLESYKSRL